MVASRELTVEEAIALSDTNFWEQMTPREIAIFQMNTRKLCMPWEVFHAAVETVLGRPVWTHEFGLDYEGLKKELNGEKGAPTFQDILELIPKDKRIVLQLD